MALSELKKQPALILNENSSIEVSSPGNIRLVAASYLARRGYDITIITDRKIVGKENTTHVIVSAADYETYSKFRKIVQIPELEILYKAYSGIENDPQTTTAAQVNRWLMFDEVGWDSDTKTRIEALYWENVAKKRDITAAKERSFAPKVWQIYRRSQLVQASNLRADNLQTNANVARDRGREVRGDLSQMTQADTTALAEDAIKKYLITHGYLSDVERVLAFDEQVKAAFSYVRQINEGYIGSQHLLFGILHTDHHGSLSTLLGIDLDTLLESHVSGSTESTPETTGGKTATVVQIIFEADKERVFSGRDIITPTDLLIGILRSKTDSATLLLKLAMFNLDPMEEFKEETITKLRSLAAQHQL